MRLPRSVRRSFGLGFESLESRRVLAAVFVEVGGTGDGSANDPFGSIQAAVDAAAANPGRDTVIIREGTYTENVDIEDDGGLTIRGIGDVTIQADDPDEDVIKSEGDVTYQNIKTVGGDRGIDAEDGSVVLKHVDIAADDADGLRVRDGASVFILHSTFTTASEDNDGIDLEADDEEQMGDVRIVHSSVSGVSDDGLEVDDATSIQVIGGSFSNNGDEGMDIDETGQVRLVNVEASDNGGSGLQVNADGGTISSVSIIGGLFENNDANGMEILEGGGGTIEEAHVINNTANGNGAMGFDVNVSGNLVAHGNRASGNGDDTLP